MKTFSLALLGAFLFLAGLPAEAHYRMPTLRGIVAPLANKIVSIQHSCRGTRINSSFRPYSYGSLHSRHRAVDISGNYRCIYAQLKRWPGGVSIDARAVRHVHVSYMPHGQEWGVRFRHGYHRYAYRQYAHRYYFRRSWHHRLYAARW